MSYAPAQAAAYDVTKVAGGCGVGFYRGPLGGCVRAGERAVIAPRPVVVAPRPIVVAPRPVVVAPRPIVRPRPVVIDRRPIVIR
ncbi:GCG_CRPN prefix-to-repeats domain-containing protein [Bosea rubneri]|uniref:GCG_CRPN prefix-to-repeats domain-containing protein n=1 Tax=Bosea rubneri TaxID=3075434 RepID=UPI0036F2D51A